MRLSDTFMETMAFTLHCLRDVEHGQEAPYEDIRSRYDILCQRAIKQALEGGCTEENWREAWFAVCAWIDELLLCSSWPDRGRWEHNPLQWIHFGTMNGGVEFFQRLEALSPEQGQIREVYIYCLTLGFKGRFFAAGNDQKLADIQNRHLEIMKDIDDMNPTSRLFPEAYIDGPAPVRRVKWRHGLSRLHITTVAGSLLVLITLYAFFKHALGYMVAAYLGYTP